MGELVTVVAHPVALPVAHVDDAVVGAEAVSVNRRRQLHLATDNGLETGFFTVRHDLRVDAPVALVDAEDDGFTLRPAAALTTHAARAEVRLIDFDFTLRKWRGALALFGDALTDFEKIVVTRLRVSPVN